MAKTLPELIEAYQAIYYMEDPSVIPLLCSVVIAAKMQGDPVWLALVGGSSSGKTELINAVSGVDYVEQISMVTPNTFLSGARVVKGQETSLLMKLPPEFVLVFKDFTSILSMNKDDLKEIMAQFRELFDGRMDKKTGMGKNLTWKGKCSVIAGTTEEIHVKEQLFSTAGVRFVYFTLPLQDRIKTTKRAAQIAEKLPVYRELIQREFTEYINTMLPLALNKSWMLSEEVSDKIIAVADFATRARSPVVRDYRGNMEMVLSQEMPMRFSTQLHNIARAEIAQNNGVLSPTSEMNLYKIAFDSIPKGRYLILKEMFVYDYITTKGLAVKLRFQTERVRMWLEELNWLGVVERGASTSSLGDRWNLTTETRQVLGEYHKLQYQGGGLEARGVDDEAQSLEETFRNL